MTVCTEEAPCTLSIDGPGWFALQYRRDEDIKATISTNVTTDIYVGKGWYRVYPDSFNNDLAILGMNSTVTLDSGLLLFNSKGNPSYDGFTIMLYVDAVDEKAKKFLNAQLTVSIGMSDVNSGAEGLIKSIMSTVCTLVAVYTIAIL